MFNTIRINHIMRIITNGKTKTTKGLELFYNRFCQFVGNIRQIRELTKVNQRLASNSFLIHRVVNTSRNQRHHCLCRIFSLSKLGWPPIETCSEMPITIILKWENINKYLQIINSRLSDHVCMIFNIITSELI